MSLRDPEVCICNAVNGGDPCSSPRCIRLGDAIDIPPSRAGSSNTIYWAGGPPFASGGGGGSSSATRICVEEEAYPVCADRIPRSPRVPSWQELRETWLETGDLAALTAMDQYDVDRMSGEDWLDCDQYDFWHGLHKTPPQPQQPNRRRPRYLPAVVIAVTLGVIAAWITFGILLSHGMI